MKHVLQITTCLLLTVLLLPTTYGQAAEENDLMSLSLENLLEMTIVSASKKEESAFNSPLSTSVISKQEMENAGVTSIPEALRLAPGIIVKEYINGSYDVHLRGLENTPPNAPLSETQNLVSLVMIDGRVVFNYLNGGILWNSLPVDLNDVERIEIIRGPSSALYGPNAVTGVINIITTDPESEGLNVLANAQSGNHWGGDTNGASTIVNGNIGYKQEKFSINVTGNYQGRDRYEDQYYLYTDGDYTDLPATITSFILGPISNVQERYPNPGKSMEKYGFNTYLNFNQSDQVDFSLDLGYQNAESQILFNDNGYTPLLYTKSNSFSADFRAAVNGISLAVSNINGEQSQNNGSPIPYNIFASSLEYDWALGDILVRPGISFNSAKYDWELISNDNVTTTAASLRADYFKEKYRLIAALRADSYSSPSDIYLTWQFAAMYNLNERNVLRLVGSRANAAPFIDRLYLDIDIPIPPAGIGIVTRGNEDYDLKIQDMYEFGLRSKLSSNFSVDLEAFYSVTQNYNEIYFESAEVRDGLAYINDQVQNMDLTAKQRGTSVTLNFVPNENLQLRAFGTYQKTDLEDFAPDVDNQTNLVTKEHKGTHSFYGGFYANYRWNRINFNVNGYYLDSHSLDKSDGEIPFPVPTTVVLDTDVSSNFILNAKASYQATDQLNVYINARNLGADGAQFGFAERISSLVMLGLNFKL